MTLMDGIKATAHEAYSFLCHIRASFHSLIIPENDTNEKGFAANGMQSTDFQLITEFGIDSMAYALPEQNGFRTEQCTLSDHKREAQASDRWHTGDSNLGLR